MALGELHVELALLRDGKDLPATREHTFPWLDFPSYDGPLIQRNGCTRPICIFNFMAWVMNTRWRQLPSTFNQRCCSGSGSISAHKKLSDMPSLKVCWSSSSAFMKISMLHCTNYGRRHQWQITNMNLRNLCIRLATCLIDISWSLFEWPAWWAANDHASLPSCDTGGCYELAQYLEREGLFLKPPCSDPPPKSKSFDSFASTHHPPVSNFGFPSTSTITSYTTTKSMPSG